MSVGAEQNLSDMHEAPSSYDDFQKKGHPGRFYGVETVADGMTAYTGSRWGFGAVIVQTHGSAVFHLSGGGTIAATNLSAGVVYEFSLQKITDASSAVIYLLKTKE